MLRGKQRSPARSSARRAYIHYLRTGQRLAPPAFEEAPAGIEFKFNPYHDPRNGRFTFAPGGLGSLSGGLIPDAKQKHTSARFAANESENRSQGRGNNYDAMLKPMTLEVFFPGFEGALPNRVIALADSFLDFTGPANTMLWELAQRHEREIVSKIKSLNPRFVEHKLARTTFEGEMEYLNDLRWTLARTTYEVRRDPRLLQGEMLRLVQRQVDSAYAEGLRLLRSGQMDVRPSAQVALGNYIDSTVRRNLREYLRSKVRLGTGININSRAYNSSAPTPTYTQPDIRVYNVAFDMSLEAKRPNNPQVIGFFNADFRPIAVVIVRPSQLGAGSTYIITRP